MKKSSPGTPLNYHSYTCILAVSLAVKCAGIRMAHSQKVNIIIPRSRNCALSVRDHTGRGCSSPCDKNEPILKKSILLFRAQEIVRSPYAITLAAVVLRLAIRMSPFSKSQYYYSALKKLCALRTRSHWRCSSPCDKNEPILKKSILLFRAQEIVRSPYAITLALCFAFRYSSSLFARGRHRARFVHAHLVYFS